MATTSQPAATAAVIEKAVVDPNIPQTSVDRYQPSEATVRFRRWATHGNTAYLRGQEAGFSLAEAESLRRRGVGDILSYRDVASQMITK